MFSKYRDKNGSKRNLYLKPCENLFRQPKRQLRKNYFPPAKTDIYIYKQYARKCNQSIFFAFLEIRTGNQSVRCPESVILLYIKIHSQEKFWHRLRWESQGTTDQAHRQTIQAQFFCRDLGRAHPLQAPQETITK